MSLYSQTILARAPVLYLRLGELSGTAAVDSSIAAVTSGTYGGGYTLGMAGPLVNDNDAAVKFDGVNGGISGIGGGSAIQFIANSLVFWFSFFMKLTDNTAAVEQAILSNNSGSSVFKGVYFAWANSDGNKRLNTYVTRAAVGDPVINSLSNNNTITDNLWHHIAIVGNGTNVIHYVDGVSKGGSGTAGSFSSGGDNEAIYVARYSGGGYLAAMLDELAVGNTVLTAAQIAAQVNAAALTAPAFRRPIPRLSA